MVVMRAIARSESPASPLTRQVAGADTGRTLVHNGLRMPEWRPGFSAKTLMLVEAAASQLLALMVAARPIKHPRVTTAPSAQRPVERIASLSSTVNARMLH